MSILIKGMEMPTDCIFCPLFHGEWQMCSLTERGTQLIGRAKDCPLVPVPDHGDLIDKQYAYQNTMAMGEHTRKIILKQINALPIVIPADKEETE